MRGCTRCPALVRCRSQVVPGDGAIPADIAFVGLAPGRFGGDRTGVPFSGDRSGDLLRLMIKRAGLKRVFITNLVRCNPQDAKGRNRDPHPEEIAACRSHLEFEMTLVRPRIVACLGRVAWSELAGRHRPFDPCKPQVVDVGELHVFPLYHPAYINRGAYPRRSYASHFRTLARIIGN